MKRQAIAKINANIKNYLRLQSIAMIKVKQINTEAKRLNAVGQHGTMADIKSDARVINQEIRMFSAFIHELREIRKELE